MPALRFSGMARTNRQFDQVLQQYVGWRAQIDGDDWVVPENDPVLQAGPRPFIEQPTSISLLTENGRTDAVALIERLHRDDRQLMRQGSLPRRVTIVQGWGFRSEVEERLLRFFLASDANIRQEAEAAIRFARAECSAERMIALKANHIYQQGLLSLWKIAYLTNQHGATRAEELVMRRRALDGALPGPTELFSFVDPFLCFSPSIIAFPFHRFSFVLCFIGRKPMSFPYLGVSSIFDKFVTGNEVIAPLGLYDLIEDFTLRRAELEKYVRYIVEGINSIAAFLNEPRNFADTATGSLDLLKQMQFYGGLWYCFADLQHAAEHHSSRSRINAAFAGFDKLANLRWKIDPTIGETAHWQGFFSDSQLNEVRAILRRKLRPHSGYLEHVVSRAIGSHFRSLHRSLAANLAANSEQARLQKLRSFRNLNHGTFLSKSQFENLFLSGGGILEPDVIGIFYMTMLALISDPTRFLNFRPTF